MMTIWRCKKGGVEEEDFERSVQTLVDSTIHYVIQDDKKELYDLLRDLKHEVVEDFNDTVLELEELVNIFMTSNILENEPVADKIKELMLKLYSSTIPRTKLIRVKMLVNDIEKNRYRIREIMNRLMNSNGTEETVLNILVQKGLLSHDQRQIIEKILRDNDCRDIQQIQIANVIKDTKIGRGINFLPRKIDDLVKSLHMWLEELVGSGHVELKKKVSAVLDELLNRRSINKQNYESIKKDNNIS